MAYVVQSSPVVISKSSSFTELGRPATYTLKHTFGLTGTVIINDGSGRQLALTPMSISGMTWTPTLLYDAAAQLVQYQFVNGSYFIYATFDFSQRTDGGAKVTYQWNLSQASTARISMLASRSMATGETVAGDGVVSPLSGSFHGLGFDWTDIPGTFNPTYNGGQLTLTLPATGELDPATVGTSTDAYPLRFPLETGGPYYIPGTGLWWMFWFDGTNLVYSSCATLTGTWAGKATAVSGMTEGGWAIASDGTYLHIGYYVGTALNYIQCSPASNGTLNPATIQTVIASGGVVGYSPSICVSSDGYVCIGFVGSSNTYPYLVRNAYQSSSSTWTTASGFPVLLASLVQYSPHIAPGLSGYINVLFAATSTTIGFRTVSPTASLSSIETVNLASTTMPSQNFPIVVDPSTGTTYIAYVDGSNNLKTRARTSGGTWDGSEATHSTVAGTYPALERDVIMGNVYVIWIDASNNVYYDMWNGSAWGGATLLQNESTDGGLTQMILNAPQSSQNGYLAVSYKTKSASPYNVKVAGLALTRTWTVSGTVPISASVAGTVLDNKNWIISGTIAITAGVTGSVIDSGSVVQSNIILDLNGGTVTLQHLEQDNLFKITNSSPATGTITLSPGSKIHFDNVAGAGFDPLTPNIALVVNGTVGEPCIIDCISGSPSNAWSLPADGASVTATYCTFTNCQYKIIPPSWSLTHCTFNWIAASVPVASFTADVTTLKSPNQTTFTDTSTNLPTVRLWTFGDGRTSTEQNPKHQWNQPGTFSVTLKVTNAAGSSTSSPMMITVTNPQVNMAMTIGGTDITAQYQTGTLNISGALGMRKTASMTLHNPNSFRPSVGAQVIITDINTSTRIFGGLIWTSPEIDNELTGDNWYNVSMTSFDGLADRHQVNEMYSNMTADAIILDLVSKYLAVEGVTTANVQVGPLISSVFWQFATMAKCLDDLCQNSGYSWYIDDFKDLHFYNTASLTCPVSLTDASNNFRAMQVTRSLGDYFNAEWILGANATSDPLPEMFNGNGKATTFTLSKGCITVPSITLNGSVQTVGISQVDTGKQWYWSSGSQAITQDQSGTPLISTDTLIVKYQFAYPNLEYGENANEIYARSAIEGTTGRYETFKSIDSLITGAQNKAYIAADITKFGRVSEVASWESDNPTIMAGQVMSAVVSQHGLNGNYLITSVKVKEVSKAILRRTVTAQGGQFLSQWTDYFKSLASKSSKPVNIGSGSVLLLAIQGKETLVLSDSMTATLGTNVNTADTATVGFCQAE